MPNEPAPGGSPPPGGTPSVVDLGQAPPVSPPEAPVDSMPAIPRAGVTLSKWLLVMISVFVSVSIIWIWSSEFAFTHRVDGLLKAAGAAQEKVTAFYKDQTDFREFWLKIFQMVLLNVLLPVLTALLGYVFGSAQRERPKNP